MSTTARTPPAPALPSRPLQTINLMRGWPSPDVLPVDLLQSATTRVLSDKAISTPALQYGPDAGYGPLREGMAAWLGRHFSVAPDHERICISGGASQSVACLMQTYTDPAYTRAVWVVAPCYYLVCPIFEDAGFKGRLRATPEDEEGIDLGALEEGIKALDEEEDGRPQLRPFKGTRPFRKNYRHVIYVVTTSSNPSGKTMSLRRREGLVQLARKYDALVISDDVYDFLQWRLPSSGTGDDAPPEIVPRLCDIDRSLGQAQNDPEGFGHAISNGSFSKIVGPGFRTGWVEGTPAFIHGLSLTGSSRSGGAPSQFCAAALSQLVHSGELEEHVSKTVVPGLRRRHGLLMNTVREHVLGTGVTAARESGLVGGNTYGGYFVWMTLEPGLSAAAVAQAALAEENLIIGSGGMFEVAGDEKRATFDSNIRLCFAWEPEEALVEGTKRLGRLLKRMKENKAYYQAKGQSGPDEGFVNANK